jgi:D-alanine-D-alanine ligase-like ATP-grasp enzyme
MSGTGVLTALQSRGVDAHAFDPGTQTLAELEAARFDRVFIALHGRGGEDGTIQGVLETLRVPYTGSGVQASAIAIDKLATKRVWLQERIPTPRDCSAVSTPVPDMIDTSRSEERPPNSTPTLPSAFTSTLIPHLRR